MSLTSLLVPTYKQMLRTLAGLLDKAEVQRPDGLAEGLLAGRLAPDMYPLASQIRFAAFQAQEAVYRLTEAVWPDSLHQVAAEGRDAGETPGTIAEAKARIDEALTCLDGLAPDALDAGSGLAIALNLPDGLAFDLTGEQYARDWALPQLYFHVVSAYAILRRQGIAIGKADYVPHMFAYLRTGTPARA
ncbi:DUF1993 domain-containing protein [Methylobacterium sp. E-005]|uniref:DUF1993 domain-containing protein n=1 Tax=Methylobacterium sp. E-005 TaxID=2836549 RepID=UPI001FBA6FEA|nr:DUF1993 domain-containing protein [Methylobacterium sp. E-005]MCJ2085121.1 DUF1993 domain-containing protein [Methylobacterium sp. E-005]